ncbi:12340_t:CDS:1, partial [Cetraspora pellucida]
HEKAEKCLYNKNGIIIGKTYHRKKRVCKSKNNQDNKLKQDKEIELYENFEEYEKLEQYSESKLMNKEETNNSN